MDEQILAVLLNVFLLMEIVGIKFLVPYKPVKEVERMSELLFFNPKHDRYQIRR